MSLRFALGLLLPRRRRLRRSFTGVLGESGVVLVCDGSARAIDSTDPQRRHLI